MIEKQTKNCNKINENIEKETQNINELIEDDPKYNQKRNNIEKKINKLAEKTNIADIINQTIESSKKDREIVNEYDIMIEKKKSDMLENKNY